MSSGKSACRVFLLRCFWARRWQGAGTTYQGMLRNPLVSPDILGVSAGAGLGACAAILWGLSIVYIQLYAFCGGLMVVAGVWLITRRVTRHDPILTPWCW